MILLCGEVGKALKSLYGGASHRRGAFWVGVNDPLGTTFVFEKIKTIYFFVTFAVSNVYQGLNVPSTHTEPIAFPILKSYDIKVS